MCARIHISPLRLCSLFLSISIILLDFLTRFISMQSSASFTFASEDREWNSFRASKAPSRARKFARARPAFLASSLFYALSTAAADLFSLFLDTHAWAQSLCSREKTHIYIYMYTCIYMYSNGVDV